MRLRGFSIVWPIAWLCLALGVAGPLEARSAKQRSTVSRKSAETPAESTVAPTDALPFEAQIAVTAMDTTLLFPPDLSAKLAQEQWDVWALQYQLNETPSYRKAYVAERLDNGAYRLPAGYLKDRFWALRLVLSPPKGPALEREFRFFDRRLEDTPPAQ